ncbi:MAG: methylmalonyl Co-A mutase-associated GTPase MeaB [Chloroflexi bacterium]|nr:methylmalonyl Co-A mutase-associated GTPase MeaB [Chloroflexota bacterium]
MDLAQSVLQGDRRALARLLTRVENHSPEAEESLGRLYAYTGLARTIGVTGMPGAGKSTLVFALASELRRRGQTVGIVAVDPSSPFTRGALLGDRVRMQELTSDPGVFIRSMATRGAMGGLAAGTIDVMAVLDAFGMDVIIVETVGAGQDEVDVVRAAHTVLVVEIPGTGDEVQSLKAGILEIADVFVVNKADRPGADAMATNLRQLISLQPKKDRTHTPLIVKTVATKGQGIRELADAIQKHQAYLEASGKLQERNLVRFRFQILALAQHRLMERLLESTQKTGLLEQLVEAVNDKELDPHRAARLLEQTLAAPVGPPAGPSTD